LVAEKVLAFCPLLRGRWSDLAENFIRSLFPHPHLSAKFRLNPFGFRNDMRENVIQHHVAGAAIE